MFDWLFGSKRQTNFDDTNALWDQYSAANTAADDYYKSNIENVDWDSLGQDEKARRVQEFGSLDSQRQSLGQDYGQMNEAYNQESEKRKHDYFGDGLLGTFLNPIGQTFTAAGDMLSGEYDDKGRDVASDLGAAGQTALSLLPFLGGLSKFGGAIGKAGAGVSKAVNSVPGMAATGAGFSAGETLRQQGSDADLGDLLISAGTGAAFGAGIPLAGRYGGKLLKSRGSNVLGKELAQSGVADDVAQRFIGAVPNRALYQTALKSFVPKSTVGRLAAGGGALYGASRLMGGGQAQDPSAVMASQYSSPEIAQIAQELSVENGGIPPSEFEVMQLLSGGY
ncbi:hypothetical protein CQ476_37 [TM7 phage DolZOral124_53_65]|nr:hypothetical protein CQ476_37 [TM7 phage DolZOral124_53_65]